MLDELELNILIKQGEEKLLEIKRIYMIIIVKQVGF